MVEQDLRAVTDCLHAYYKDPLATSTALRDGWLHSGDAGFLTETGELTMLDRIQDVMRLSDGEPFAHRPFLQRERGESTGEEGEHREPECAVRGQRVVSRHVADKAVGYCKAGEHRPERRNRREQKAGCSLHTLPDRQESRHRRPFGLTACQPGRYARVVRTPRGRCKASVNTIRQ